MGILDIFSGKNKYTQKTALDEVRTKYPQYSSVPDDELAAGLAKKFPDRYGDLTKYEPDAESPKLDYYAAKDTIADYKKQFPVYKDIPDNELADKMTKVLPDQFGGLIDRIKAGETKDATFDREFKVTGPPRNRIGEDAWKLKAPEVDEEFNQPLTSGQVGYMRPGDKPSVMQEYEEQQSWKALQTMRDEMHIDITQPGKELVRPLKGWGRMSAGMVRAASGATRWLGPKDGGKAEAAAESVAKYLDKTEKEMNDYYAIKDPKFLDDLYTGAASTLLFYIPGAGVAKATKSLAVVSQTAANVFGATASGVFEALVNAGGTYADARAKGWDHDRANWAATKNFWAEAPMNAALEKFSFFGDATGARRIGTGIVGEGSQEGMQDIIASIALGEVPEPGKVAKSTLLGSIIGAGGAAIQNASGAGAEDITTPEGGFKRDGKGNIIIDTTDPDGPAGQAAAREEFEAEKKLVIEEVSDLTAEGMSVENARKTALANSALRTIAKDKAKLESVVKKTGGKQAKKSPAKKIVWKSKDKDIRITRDDTSFFDDNGPIPTYEISVRTKKGGGYRFMMGSRSKTEIENQVNEMLKKGKKTESEKSAEVQAAIARAEEALATGKIDGKKASKKKLADIKKKLEAVKKKYGVKTKAKPEAKPESLMGVIKETAPKYDEETYAPKTAKQEAKSKAVPLLDRLAVTRERFERVADEYVAQGKSQKEAESLAGDYNRYYEVGQKRGLESEELDSFAKDNANTEERLRTQAAVEAKQASEKTEEGKAVKILGQYVEGHGYLSSAGLEGFLGTNMVDDAMQKKVFKLWDSKYGSHFDKIDNRSRTIPVVEITREQYDNAGYDPVTTNVKDDQGVEWSQVAALNEGGYSDIYALTDEGDYHRGLIAEARAEGRDIRILKVEGRKTKKVTDTLENEKGKVTKRSREVKDYTYHIQKTALPSDNVAAKKTRKKAAKKSKPKTQKTIIYDDSILSEENITAEDKTALDRVRKLAKKLGVRIKEYIFVDQYNELDIESPDAEDYLAQAGVTLEEAQNAAKNGYSHIIGGEHKLYGTRGQSDYGSRIVIYKGHGVKELYHEFAHAVEEQGGIPGWVGTKEQHARYLEEILARGEEESLPEFDDRSSRILQQELTPYREFTVTEGAAVIDLAGVHRSIRTIEQSKIVFDEANKKSKTFPQNIVNRYFRAMDNVAARIIANKDLLDFVPAKTFSSLKDNADKQYGDSLDFSTMCAKRAILQATLDDIQVAIDRPLSSEEIMDVLVTLKKANIKVSCGACYVYSRRLNMSTVIWKALKWSYRMQAPRRVRNAEGKMVRPAGPPQRIKVPPLAVPRKLLLSQKGIDEIARKYPGEYKKLRKLFAGTQMKIPEARTEYDGEIMKKLAGSVKKINNASGLRWQSWSDFELPHLLDGMQAIGDMAALGMMGHTYTKEVDFVRSYVHTGMAINTSLIPLGNGFDSKGNLVFDKTQSFPYEEAMKFRKKYSNVGTIAIGVSDKHIAALLASPDIDYVIPYHQSGLSNENLAALGGEGWKDYTDEQNWTLKKGGRAEAHPYINHWQGSLKKLAKITNKTGLIPPFHRLRNLKGYEKLLTDRRIFGTDGKYYDQQPVQPKFDEAVLQDMIKKYKGPDSKSHTPTVNSTVKKLKAKPDAQLSLKQVKKSDQEDPFGGRGVKAVARDLVGTRDRTEIQNKLEKIFGEQSDLEKMDDDDMPETPMYELANKYMADLEYAAYNEDIWETEKLLSDLRKDMKASQDTQLSLKQVKTVDLAAEARKYKTAEEFIGTEKEFNKKYAAQHKDIRGKREGTASATKESILGDGFREKGFNVNALPVNRGWDIKKFPRVDWAESRYGNKKGDTVYLLPKKAVTDGPNGYTTNKGWKPNPKDVITIEYDHQSSYEAYKNQLTDIWNKANQVGAQLRIKQVKLTPEQMKRAKKKRDIKEAQLKIEDAEEAKMGAQQIVRDRRYYLNLKNYETNLFTNAIDQVTTRQQREVIPFLMEKVGFPEKLDRPELKKIYEEQGKDLQGIANQVKKHFDKGWQYMQENMDELSEAQIEDYVTHIWDIPRNKRAEVSNWFTTKNRFLKRRYIATLKAGIDELGMKPKHLDISTIIRIHDSVMHKVVANKRTVDQLLALRKDGVRLIERSNDAPPDWVAENHPALQKSLVIPEHKNEAGQDVPMQIHKLSVKVHPDLARVIKVMFDSKINSTGLRAVAMLNGVLKKSWLSVSLFHHIALMETGVATTSPWGAAKIYLNIPKMYRAIAKNQHAIFEKSDIARDAISHGMQSGATSDIPVAMIQQKLDDVAYKLRKIPGVSQVAKTLATANEVWDKVLWGYLHDNLKLYGYEALVAKIDPESTDAEIEAKKIEIAQMVNDTYGGQNWDTLMVTPRELQAMSLALLSPDWLVSTTRQGLSLTGIGAVNKDMKKFRAKMGRSFWIKAAIYFGGGVNLLNALLRWWDEKEHPEYYKGQERGWKDRFMWGNVTGHQTHLFAGRYEDGKERYIRWGKQFREVPELLWDDTEFSPVTAVLKKLGGKVSPAVNLIVQSATGTSLSGFENQNITREHGRARALAIFKELGKAPIPFSMRSMLDENKEFYLTDLALPSSKGMSGYKVKELFKRAMLQMPMKSETGWRADRRRNAAERLYKETWEAAVNNGLPPITLYKAAMTSLKTDYTRSIAQSASDLQELMAAYKEAKTDKQRAVIARRIRRIQKERADWATGNDLLKQAIEAFKQFSDDYANETQ